MTEDGEGEEEEVRGDGVMSEEEMQQGRVGRGNEERKGGRRGK